MSGSEYVLKKSHALKRALNERDDAIREVQENSKAEIDRLLQLVSQQRDTIDGLKSRLEDRQRRLLHLEAENGEASMTDSFVDLWIEILMIDAIETQGRNGMPDCRAQAQY